MSTPLDPLVWVPTVGGHELALDGTTLTCRNSSGRVLKSVPKAVRTSPAGEKLTELRDRLLRHETECRATVESWLLAGVPIPAALLARVWPDPGWRSCLRHLVVVVDGQVGLLEDVSEEGRTRLRGPDGTPYAPPLGVGVGVGVGPVTVPHPALLPDVAAWQGALDAAQIVQGITQLAREVHRRPADVDPEATSVDDYAGGYFEELRHATARAAQHGFVMRGGFAVVRTVGRGAPVQARYWLGADDPGLPAGTGRLIWVDEAERPVPLGEVGPVAWSEGVRMAALIYGGRQTHDQ
ncbi:MAG: DUF4132 domain-containing protein [Streptomyces sp.]|nr:DUF4132 domain-containing protein [Streptomyces sp.]